MINEKRNIEEDILQYSLNNTDEKLGGSIVGAEEGERTGASERHCNNTGSFFTQLCRIECVSKEQKKS